MQCMDVASQPQAERTLLVRAREGDADAFCRLAETYESRLLHQAVSLCHDHSGAQDLVQQTLIEAWKSLKRFDERCRLSTWLFSILLHRYQKSLRYARSRPISWSSLPSVQAEEMARLNQQSPSDSKTPDQVLAKKESQRILRQLMDTLPPKHQVVIWLRFFEDASLEEIAATLHQPLGTIKSRLHHGLEKLRRLSARMNHFNPGEES